MSVTTVATTTGAPHGGESLGVPERVIVAPDGGLFEAAPPETVTADGEIVHAGQTIGTLTRSGTSTPVKTPFAGFLMEVLAVSGERVREGQPIAWLRVFDPRV